MDSRLLKIVVKLQNYFLLPLLFVAGCKKGWKMIVSRESKLEMRSVRKRWILSVMNYSAIVFNRFLGNDAFAERVEYWYFKYIHF